MQIEQLLFALASILIAGYGAIHLKGWAGKIITLIVVIGTIKLGPKVFGSDWFDEGYMAGLVLGGLAWEAFQTPGPNSSSADKS